MLICVKKRQVKFSQKVLAWGTRGNFFNGYNQKLRKEEFSSLAESEMKKKSLELKQLKNKVLKSRFGLKNRLTNKKSVLRPQEVNFFSSTTKRYENGVCLCQLE